MKGYLQILTCVRDLDKAFMCGESVLHHSKQTFPFIEEDFFFFFFSRCL